MAEKEKNMDKETEIPEIIPVLPVRDIVVFPYMIIPLFVGREMSIKAIEQSLAEKRMILLLTQRDMSVENPTAADLYESGTVGMIMRMLKLPDGRVKILVQGLSKARVKKFLQATPYMEAEIAKIEDTKPATVTIEEEAQIRTVKEQLDKAVSYGKTILPDIMVVIENLDEPGRLADLVASNLGLKTEQGDFGKIVAIGVPPSILVLLAIVMCAAGCIWQLQFLPLAGIRSQDPFWRKLVVFLAGIPVLLLCAVIYQTLFGGDYYVPTWRGYMLAENLRKAKTIQMGRSIVLLTAIAALHKPLFPWLDRLSHTPVGQVRWRDTLIAIGLGLAMTIIQLMFFNDPTLVAR